MEPVPAAQLDTIRRAYRVAVRDLRACYNPEGIVAGRLHFNAYWARDGFWALFGSLALGDYDQARMQLDLFIRYQTPSGELPVRIEFVGHTFGSYHTQRVHPKALYRAGTVFADPLDPTALFIVAAREYYLRTGDTSFCERFGRAMDRAIRWLMQHDRDGDGIIENNYLAGWMNSILKKDKVFYLNVTHYEALRACEVLRQVARRCAPVIPCIAFGRSFLSTSLPGGGGPATSPNGITGGARPLLGQRGAQGGWDG